MTEASAETNPPPKADPAPKRPKVLIVGAGLGGVVLGALLEKAGCDYEIFERAPVVKPLGSAIAIGCNIVGLFRQLGIEKEFLEQSKPTLSFEVYDTNKEVLFEFDNRMQEEKGGSHIYVTSRPIIHDMVLRLIPPKRLHFGKRILSTDQNEHGVLIHTEDGQTYEGDILVGADGAYSRVRQSLYERLMKDNKLPASDAKRFPLRYVSLVGQTMPLDPEEYPELKEKGSPYQCMIIDRGHALTTFNTKHNTILWNMVLTLDKETKEAIRNHAWGPEVVEQMCNDVKDLPILNGNGNKTMKDLIENTPKHLISKVKLEEKVFKTWYSGRTVLLGDAIHKMNPSGGMGAVCAMLDAVVLANWINVIQVGESMEDVEKKFKAYKSERLPSVMRSYFFSKNNTTVIGTTFHGKLARWLANLTPTWILNQHALINVAYRPIVSFLPPPPDTGSVKAKKQPSLIETRKILDREERNVVAV